MSIRQVYGVRVVGDSAAPDVFSVIMTVISNVHGRAVRSRADAQAVVKELLPADLQFVLEPRFVLLRPDGSFLSFPEPTRHFADPYLYPLDIAYGFILDGAVKQRREPAVVAIRQKRLNRRFSWRRW